MRDITWYLKWTATVILIVATAVNSLGYYPAGPMLLILGGIFWTGVSIIWKETSLIVTNVVMLLTATAGIIYHYFS